MSIKHTTIQDISSLQKQYPNLVIIDVRTQDEFLQGSIPGAINIDIMDTKGFRQACEIYRHNPVVVYCRSGGRSQIAAHELKNMNFECVYNCSNGYSSLN